MISKTIKYQNELIGFYKKNHYFNLEYELSLIDKYFPKTRLILFATERGSGKSSCMYDFIKKNYLDKNNDRIFAILRTSNDEADAVLQSVVESEGIELINKNKKSIIIDKFKTNKQSGKIVRTKNNKLVGVVWAVSSQAKRKSVIKQEKPKNGKEFGTNICDYIFYDEFNQMDILKNLRMTSPFFNLLNLYKTLARENDKCKLIIFGNKDTINNYIINSLPIDVADIVNSMQLGLPIYTYNYDFALINFYNKNVFKLKTNRIDNWVNKWAANDEMTNAYFNENTFANGINLCVRNFDVCLKNIVEIKKIFILGLKEVVLIESLYKNQHVLALVEKYHLEKNNINLDELAKISLSKYGDTEANSNILDDNDMDDYKEWLFTLYKNGKLWFSSFDIWKSLIELITLESKPRE